MGVQSSGRGDRGRSECVGGGRGLKRDEVHQVALGRSHAVREEVDEGVEELRPLSVRLVYVGETWERRDSSSFQQVYGAIERRMEDFHHVYAYLIHLTHASSNDLF